MSQERFESPNGPGLDLADFHPQPAQKGAEALGFSPKIRGGFRKGGGRGKQASAIQPVMGH